MGGGRGPPPVNVLDWVTGTGVLTAPRPIPERGMKKASVAPAVPRPLPGSPPSVAAPAPAGVGRWEWLGLAALAGLVAYFLAVSWRKWPDPLIDFGRELYLPWRLAHGAVLYRDVDDFYGPLSQYFNAGIFTVFGPGLMVLVAVNLVIFTAIVAVIYQLFRRGWGPLAAWVAAAVFISVFGFPQSSGVGNYNYATPYAHEATHGLLVCLLLVTVLPAWVAEATPRRSFVAGGLFGLCAVLKPEIVLAAGLVTLVAWIVQRWFHRPWRPAAIGAWAAGAVLPTVLFAFYFSTQVPWAMAGQFAGRAWLNATSTRFTGDPVQMRFLGFDQPGPHALQHLGATLFALGVIAVIAGGVWLVDRPRAAGRRWLLLVAMAVGLGLLSWFKLPWVDAGRCLLGLALIYGAVCVVTLLRQARTGTDFLATTLRLLLAMLAVALLGRMLLNGRIPQFGFYQAALATLLVPAVLIGELPARLRVGRWGRIVAVAGCLALVVPGVIYYAGDSRKQLVVKTQIVGEGRDRFVTFLPNLDPTGELVAKASSWLRNAAAGRNQTLLVLPEGEMINYLARLPSPVAPFFFFSAATRGGAEAEIVRALDRNPPDWIVLVSRDLREYGVQRYGESPEQGGQILEWAGDRYEVAATFGDDPLDYRQRGLMILKRRR